MGRPQPDGPNALWLTEALTEVMTIEPGMKVLDLRCGRAMSSIFLAREFGAQVWATDLYLGYLLDFLQPGGQVGAVMPATTRELGTEIPETLAPFWEWEFYIAPHVEGWWIDEVAKTHDMLTADQGASLGFARVVATKL